MKRTLPGLLLLLVACNGPTEPSLPGDLILTYTWEGFDQIPENCAGAWAETVWVELETELEYSDIAQPCDNAAITIEALQAGDWTVTLRTNLDIEASENGWNTSEPVPFTIDGSGDTVELSVPIVCYADGVEGRCSGL